MSKNVAVFGAAFNPPHLGHMDVVAQVKDRYDEVLCVPSAAHAFGKAMAPFPARLDWLRCLLDATYPGDAKIGITDIEQRLSRLNEDGPVYSIAVLRALKNNRPDHDFTLLIGPDNAAPEVWHRFYGHELIEREFSVEVVEERVPVRSTDVRACLAAGDRGRLVEMVGEPLAERLLSDPEAKVLSAN